MRRKFTTKALLSLFLSMLLYQVGYAQIDNCYKYMANNPVVSGDVFEVGQTAGGLICFGCNATGLSNLIDTDPDNYVAFGTLVNVFGANGVAVRNTTTDYAAGTIGGFNIDLGANLLNGDFLNAVTISTYKDGVFQESHTGSANLFAVPIFGSTTRRSFIYIHSTKAYDELRLEIGTVGTFLQTTRIHYAFNINPDCPRYQDALCDQLFAGVNTQPSFNGQLLSPLANLMNPDNLNDADRFTAADLVIPAGAISGVSAGVTDLSKLIQPGGKTGFVISSGSSSLFSASILNSLSVETYYYGRLQESKTYSGGGVNISAIAFGNLQRQRLSMTTTKPFNEVRLKVNQAAGVNIGTIKMYYAFHESNSCDGCESKIISSNTSPYTGQVVTGTMSGGFLGFGGTPWTGRYGLALNALSGTNNLIDASSTNYALYTPVIGVLNSGANITIKNNNGAMMPTGTFAGFKVEKEGSLIGGALADAITVSFYNGTTLTESKTGTSLLSASLLSGGSATATFGFVATQPFNRMRINFNDGLISGGLGGSYRVYYAYAIGDADGDGVEDCNDQCPGYDDNADNDGDGLPDCPIPVVTTPTTPVVTQPGTTEQYTVYPNPGVFGDPITISGDANEAYTYQILDRYGYKEKSGSFTGKVTVKPYLFPDTYFVHIFKGGVLVKKIQYVVTY